MFTISQSSFLQALGWAVLNSLWQMALLWVIYQSVTAVFRVNKSSQKGNLATLLLFSGSAWFAFTFFSILIDRPVSTTGYTSFVTIQGNSAVNDWLFMMLPIASIVYLVLLILPILNFIRNYRFVQAIRNYGLSKANVKWRMFAHKIAAQMSIGKSVQVWMSEFITSPVTVGYLKPMILLPVAAINHLSPQQIEAILLHELSHIKRFDYLINLITRSIQTILYFNPFVKAFASIIEREREKNCDEIVLQFQYEPHGYASALLELEKVSHMPHSLAVAATAGRKNELLNRIESILGIQKKPALSFNKLAGIMAALLCFISINALLLLSKPGQTGAAPGLFTDLAGPFHLYATPAFQDVTHAQKEGQEELESTPIANHLVASIDQPASEKEILMPSKKLEKAPLINPFPVIENESSLPYGFVSFTENIIPVLDQEKEVQVQEVLDASKKVLTEEQWKDVEITIADALNSQEKDKVKLEYQKAMDKLDWDKMENKLRLSYNEINWKQVNSELNKALVEIKLDSLQKVYTTVISNLSCLKKELVEAGDPGIPDTDITLETVECKRKKS
jgi:beta-lactamase regulating signal transducer with metallopeptidase domain